ncbi:CRISPR-associated endonuclease Cas2 [Candidatus Korarchaeum cryptofilum]|uniref:CRISPR-associated endoribonuclease Cas2 n=1 Tax=Korarchaeum cryptofilum (strain OPF8) TaxID=374847 RepID=CAS2_KORCO|nr:CRISPR-associated endonuclease Cas2 [Candidatus Korarchaeum cryptofilum]B1L402.1 RecName: Full=CRISPR-associated endoribonuclease Cas2 [Candidatus Korarchaeum cryptofilum OPF8]ACB07181.1 CRISPR-associated protein Cas2 [Candidatus Korarchaeum cryptofilum OPF8]
MRGGNLKVLVVYDITDDSLRLKVAEILKDLGLFRIQKSAFIGEMTSQERENMEEILRRQNLGPSDRIDVFPICDRDLKMHSQIGRGKFGRGPP